MAVAFMRMLLGCRAPPSAFISILVWLLLSLTEPSATWAQNDVDCLRALRSSLEDPLGYLASWDFSNSSKSICSFVGIECWNAVDNRVLNIQLSDLGLKGDFPLGLAGCKSLVALDLSKNSIRGNIPNDISELITFVTSLDLSSNRLSGGIPAGLANCTFLNVLRLDSNRLTGRIPPEIGRLSRLKTFSVANNRLSGQVPTFGRNGTSPFPPESYANNAGLCGSPLPPCREVV